MKRNLINLNYLGLICLGIFFIFQSGCSKEDEPDIFEYLAVRSWCDPLVIAIEANQTVTIKTSGTVITNPTGVVEDCDFWTDADGIPDCHYVDTSPELHGLPFMALIGYFDGEYFLVGTYFKRTFTKAGDLELSVNDWGGCLEESDNDGKFIISVLIE